MLIRRNLEKFCAEISLDRKLVQAAGGNVSWKEDNTLWVKASGTWLADAEIKDIFIPVDLGSLRQSFTRKFFSVSPEVLDGYKLKPSIETLLHAVMPQKIVVHLHPVEILPWLVAANHKQGFGNIVASIGQERLISYQKPGEQLAEEIYYRLLQEPKLSYLFLQNHGIVIGGETIGEIRKLLGTIISSYGVKEKHKRYVSNVPTQKQMPSHSIYSRIDDEEIQALVTDKNLYQRLHTSWALYPDHIIFLGANPVLFKSLDELSKYEMSTSKPSPVVFVENVGIFATKLLSKAKYEQLRCYFDVLVRLPEQCEVNNLSALDIRDLTNWDAEKYRIKLER